LGKSGIVPEQLPVEEDIQKLKRRIESDNKKLLSVKQTLKDRKNE